MSEEQERREALDAGIAAPASAASDAAPPPPALYVLPIVFTGRRGEYFRIWVVNLLLTLVTAGIYSAWAKVRKARYLRNNTRVDGHVFDYHANPVAILRGRIVALVLVAAYSWAFQLSLAAGALTVAVLLVAGPLLFMRAQQFTLANTSYRGLRFGFQARTAEAYWTAVPVLVIWLGPSLIVLLAWDGEYSATFALWPLLYLLSFPWMHHRLKAYQRRNASYGDRPFTFVPALRRFYGVYVRGLGFVVLAGLLGSMAVLGTFVVHRLVTGREGWVVTSGIEHAILGGLFLGFLYVLAWPYYAARLQKIVWDRTRLGDVRFRTDIRAWPLFRIVLGNVALTVLTAGLYWPCATIAIARYRIECLHIEAESPLSVLVAGVQAAVSATGDAASEAFGLDLGF